uniref:Uncharacterized protein n=1 Tax=Lepeophtheirus salmonis TaxID=72036 RepID=A0A0K2TU50_LEPSM
MENALLFIKYID